MGWDMHKLGKVIGRHSRKFVAVVAGVIVAALSGGFTALAMSISARSGSDVEQHFITQTAAAVIPTAAGWHDIPNTTFTVTVPDSKIWLAHITFSGESRCSDASWCSVRAIVTSSENGFTEEMNPASGTNFAFDSGGQRGARSFSRLSLGLSGGSEGVTYTIKLQAQIVGGSATSVFRLDDYLTQLELSNDIL